MAEETATTVNLNGTWVMVKSENFEEMLAATGANWFMRKMASKVTPVLEIEQHGDSFFLKVTTPVRTKEERFVVGTPFESTTMGSGSVTVTPTWEGDELVMTAEPVEGGGAKPYVIRRKLDGNQLVQVTTVADVRCTRWFEKK